MMAEEQPGDFFTFRSNRYQDSLSCGLQGLLLEKDLIDVTFICEGGHYVKAHKVVLGACSPYFRGIFSEHDCKHPTVVMPDVKIVHFQSILEFVYMGEVNVKATDTMEFLDTAEMLKIKGLTLMLQDDKDPLQVEEIPENQGDAVIGVMEEVITSSSISPSSKVDTAVPLLMPHLEPEIVPDKRMRVMNVQDVDSTLDSDTASEDMDQSMECEEDPNVRRSHRMRKRSVRLPSPDMSLPGLPPVSVKKFKFDKIYIKTEPDTDDPLVETDQIIIPAIKKVSTDDELHKGSKIAVPKIVPSGEPTSELMRRFKCPLCTRSYIHKNHVRRHLKDMHPKYKKQITYDAIYVQHSPAAGPRFIHTQSVKTKTVRLPIGYDKKIQPGRSTLACPKCGQIFHRIQHLKQHISVMHRKPNVPIIRDENHEKEPRYDCPKCNKSFDIPQKLNHHYSNAHGEKKAIVKEEDCDDEIINYITTDNNEVKCPKCPKTFSMPRYFKQHYNILHRKPENNSENEVDEESGPEEDSKCPKCSKTFTKLQYLKQHYTLMHKEELPCETPQPEQKSIKYDLNVYKFKCPACPSMFQRRQHVDRHFNVKHKKTQPTVKSDIKKQVPENIEKNDGSFNGNVDPNKCPYCGKVFAAKSHLLSHVRQTHKRRRKLKGGASGKFKCNQCFKTYNFADHLRRHVYNLHGPHSRRIACKICGMVAMNLNSLRSHTSVHHPGRTVNVSDL